VNDRTFDVVVLGAGPAGEVAAGRAAQAGLDVALVEQELVGGECAYWGCMPSKALLRPGQALHEARRVPGAREAAQEPLDAAAALRRRDEVIHELDDASQLPWLEHRGITLVRGQGRLDGERRVRVDDELLHARRAVVVAVGTAATLPPIDGLADARPWTNREGTTAADVPRRLVVIGGGVVGCELGQAYATLGSEVTVLEVADRLLGREEQFAADQVGEGLRAEGVDVRVGAGIEAVHRDGEVTVTLSGAEPVIADELLVAAGRRPRTDDLGLETVGLAPGEPLAVTDLMHDAERPWLYALGDVNGRALLTHQGKEQARVAVAHMTGGSPTPAVLDGPLSPRVVFTEPQVAAVGHTLASAREAGLPVRAADAETGANAGGSFVGKGVPGMTRVVVDTERDVLVGATITGADVSEMLHAFTIAVVGEVPVPRLAHCTPCFPTRSEVWLKLLEELGC
jgi:pyruvate/2-oxoglutarate dehydrogenase complex dihydrolipoamide dehydrogenase (E3) component